MAFAVTAIGNVFSEVFIKPQKEALDEQRKNQQASLELARKQAEMADQANNKANAKTPNIAALLAANQSPGGVGSTMLTGPGGVDTSKLTLGRNTLLGA